MENCNQNRSGRLSPTLTIPENLPAETLALIRLPIPVGKMTAVCELFEDAGTRIHQDGVWLVVTKGGKAS